MEEIELFNRLIEIRNRVAISWGDKPDLDEIVEDINNLIKDRWGKKDAEKLPNV